MANRTFPDKFVVTSRNFNASFARLGYGGFGWPFAQAGRNSVIFGNA